jgi:hypothetical protein
MKTRWLAGVAIFALGFGCAQMMKITAANAADTAGGGMVDEGLHFIEHPNSFEFINTGDKRYLVIVGNKVPALDPQIKWVEGSLVIPKDSLIEARISRLQDLGIVTNGRNPPFRECYPGFEDCVEPWEPLPRPRPPQPFVLDHDHKQMW